METTASKRMTQIGVRVPENLRERIDALKDHFGTTERSEVARRLLEHGVYAVVQGVELPPAPPVEFTPDEAAAVQKYLRHSLRAHLNTVAADRPGAAVLEAWQIAGDLIKWSDGVAAQYGTTAQALVDAMDA